MPETQLGLPGTCGLASRPYLHRAPHCLQANLAPIVWVCAGHAASLTADVYATGTRAAAQRICAAVLAGRQQELLVQWQALAWAVHGCVCQHRGCVCVYVCAPYSCIILVCVVQAAGCGMRYTSGDETCSHACKARPFGVSHKTQGHQEVDAVLVAWIWYMFLQGYCWRRVCVSLFVFLSRTLLLLLACTPLLKEPNGRLDQHVL